MSERGIHSALRTDSAPADMSKADYSWLSEAPMSVDGEVNSAGDDSFNRAAVEAEIRDRLPYATDVQLMGVAAIMSAAHDRVTRNLTDDDTDMFDNGVNP